MINLVALALLQAPAPSPEFPPHFQGAWHMNQKMCQTGSDSYLFLFLPDEVRHPELEPDDPSVKLLAITDNHPDTYQRDITATLEIPKAGKQGNIRMVISKDFDHIFMEYPPSTSEAIEKDVDLSPLFLVRCSADIEGPDR